MATNTTGFTQSKTIYVDFDQDRKPSLRDIGSDQIGANGAKEISFGFGSEDLSGHTVVLETKRVVDSGLKYAIASVYTDGTSTRYKVSLTSWFTTYRSALIMAVKVFNNNGVTIVEGEITEIDNDYLISVSDTFTLTVNYAPKATAVVPTFTASELELILATIAGKQDTANGIVVLQESDALPDVSDGSKNGWTYLKKNADYSYSIYKVVDDALELIQENLFKRVSFDTTTPETTLPIGTMAWSQEHRTIVFRVTDEVVLEINQEFVFDSKASGTVNNGYPVFFVEPQGNHAISKQATADDVIANPYGLRGIATETVSNNEFFKTTQLGRVDGVNTTNWALENGGSILYFDIEETGTGAYNMTTIAPTKPNQVIKMGSIEKWSTGGASNGRIIVRIDYGESLGTLHDVDLSGVATGDILRKTNGTWTPTSDLTDLEARTTVVESDITKIKDGTIIVKKAEQDKNGNDIVDTYATKANTYTKTEVDNKVASVYKYKGSVDTYDDLPTIGLTVGDVYNVVDSGINYAWTGSEWDDIGGIEALATATNNGLMSKEDFSKLQALYDKTTLDGLLGAKVDKTTTVNGKALSTNITLDKSDVGLGNVDNTSDLNKPISTATQTALDAKAPVVSPSFTGTTTITRIEADGTTALKVEKSNGSATGNIAEYYFNGIKVGQVDSGGVFSGGVERTIANKNKYLPLLGRLSDGAIVARFGTAIWNGSAFVADNSNGFGNYSLYNNTGANSNGFGYNSLQNNTGAASNGFGNYSLFNNTGANSNGFGQSSLFNNTGANSNGFGQSSLYNNTGTASNGFGNNSLFNNTGANSNGFGHYSLYNNTGANSNGFGNYSLFNNTGANSNGFGHYSLYFNQKANNTAVGNNAYGNMFLTNASGAKTFDYTAIDTTLERATITSHSFGNTNEIVNLKYTSTTGTAIGGLSIDGVFQAKIIDANTIEFINGSTKRNITSQGTGTHTFTPQFAYTNTTSLGANTVPNKDNQVVLGDNAVDTIKMGGTFRTPASSSATGVKGEWCYDANYIYVCTATNEWKRTAITTW